MTMTNAEWMINTGHRFIELDAKYIDQEHGCRITINGKTVERVPLVNRASAIICWLDAEHKEPILDDAEKRYLKGVIRPFRNEIKAIEKDNYLANKLERIYFFTKEGELFYLKSFKANTMYKGMEQKRQYTLEELGLVKNRLPVPEPSKDGV